MFLSEWIGSQCFSHWCVCVCVADPSWQCHLQLCCLLKRQSCPNSRPLQGHQRELQRCRNMCFYIFTNIQYCCLCCAPDMTTRCLISSRQISDYLLPFLSTKTFIMAPFSDIYWFLFFFFMDVVFLSCLNRSVTSCLSFTGAASHSCGASRYSSCPSSCGASCPSAQPETPTRLDA